LIGGKRTAVIQEVSEGYISFVEELPGANTQGATLDEVRANLAEAVELVLDANRTLGDAKTLFPSIKVNVFRIPYRGLEMD
jgi:predicted RNase H-like HicB family nuclease